MVNNARYKEPFVYLITRKQGVAFSFFRMEVHLPVVFFRRRW